MLIKFRSKATLATLLVLTFPNVALSWNETAFADEALLAVSLSAPHGNRLLPRRPDFNETLPPNEGAASLSVCPPGGPVDVCIGSGMNIFTSGYIPPDPHGAVGMNSLIAVVNSLIEGVRKDGTTIFGPTDLTAMFSSLSASNVFDPKIIFDVHEQRFVVVALDITLSSEEIVDSHILVAVSKTGDPTSTSASHWYFHRINSFIGGSWADYPGIAVDEEAIYITNNMFSAATGSFTNSLLWIMPKNPFYFGGLATSTVHDYIAAVGVGIRTTHMPAMVRSPTGIAPNVGTYLIMYSGLNFGGVEAVQIIRVSNPLSTPTFQHSYVSLGNIDIGGALPTAPQLDPLARNRRIATNDRRVLQALWTNNQLWMVATVRDAAGEASAFYAKVNANGIATPTLADTGLINGESIGAGTYTFFPSIDINSKGVVAFGFAASSLNIYASAYAAIRVDNLDPAGTVRVPSLVKAGEGPYFLDAGGATSNRWGDYTGMAMDPADEDCFWAFNEYAGNRSATSPGSREFGSWMTAWGRLCHRCPSYHIWDAQTNQEVEEITNGWVGCISHPFNLEARFCSIPATTPVQFKLSGVDTTYTARGKEYVKPWFLFGDTDGDVFPNPNDKPLSNNKTYKLYVTVDGVTTTVSFTQSCPP